MAYLRTKKIKGKNYYYIVEGTRDDQGKVKQKVIKYIGTTKNILEKFNYWDKKHPKK